jgi:hypothetical protein
LHPAGPRHLAPRNPAGLSAGVVFALFLSSRYSFGLFSAAAFFALAITLFSDTSVDKRLAVTLLHLRFP